ncbi:trimeric intracellular cation channel family protein [Tunturibacter empetritectus]|uniref:Membrane protein YeiH n=1 Tax=Tunturiibacter empetritectus TaxID=3069691 RepID=A0A7W8IEA3_9BACT|nr:trimeric intracellular cation channel family protein [Edaphobacter lichenicola]MBB5315541.1 putative membrane protein YeiH [Edaphobacter lichenicola]
MAVRDWFPKYRQDVVLLAVDLVGTFVFAVEGALAGIRGELDLLGLLVVSFVTALGGGTVRDLLIGAVPPNSIRDWRYGATAFAGGGAVFCFYQSFQHVPQQLLITLDAAGLALFAMAGAAKALEFGINPMIAVLMGVLTGVGGGTIRDVLMTRVPGILNTDIYASAALAGAVVMVIGLWLKVPRTIAMTVGGVCCFVLRMVAVARHWNLPKVVAH